MSAAKHTPLIWGQLVTVCHDTDAALNYVGRYEGTITDHPECVRVRLPDCLITPAPHQVVAFAHPVCARREVKKAGIRQPRPARYVPRPACYDKDYGPTSRELADEAFYQSLGRDDIADGEQRQITGEMLYRQRQERARLPPRKCRVADVASRRDPDAMNTKRWLRTRRGLRQQAAIAKATGSTS